MKKTVNEIVTTIPSSDSDWRRESAGVLRITSGELESRAAHLRDRVERLESCVKAADALRKSVDALRRDWTEAIRYDAARAALEEMDK